MCKCLDTALSVFEHNCKLCPKSGHRLSSLPAVCQGRGSGVAGDAGRSYSGLFCPRAKASRGKTSLMRAHKHTQIHNDIHL